MAWHLSLGVRKVREKIVQIICMHDLNFFDRVGWPRIVLKGQLAVAV